MRLFAMVALMLLLAGCGVESAGTAAGVAKLQAEQAKQGKESLDAAKASLNAAAQASQDRLKRAEDGGK